MLILARLESLFSLTYEPTYDALVMFSSVLKQNLDCIQRKSHELIFLMIFQHPVLLSNSLLAAPTIYLI